MNMKASDAPEADPRACGLDLQLFECKAFRCIGTAKRCGSCVRMKKTPLFEFEVPLYRKRPINWAEQKQTR